MASSIGYGDYAPQTQAGRAFFCVWAILGAGILTVLFSVIADAYTSRFSESRSPFWINRDAMAEAARVLSEETFQRSFLTRAFIKVFQPQHAKELQHADIDVLPQAEKDGGSGSSLSLPRAETGKTRDSDGTVIPAREDDDRHDHHERAVLSLLRDVRRHLDHLIVSDDDVKDEHVDRVARRVMGEGGCSNTLCRRKANTDDLRITDREQFSRENREHVENDRSMKEFLCQSIRSSWRTCNMCRAADVLGHCRSASSSRQVGPSGTSSEPARPRRGSPQRPLREVSQTPRTRSGAIVRPEDGDEGRVTLYLYCYSYSLLARQGSAAALLPHRSGENAGSFR